jgi:hypothetical protein
MEPRIMPAIKWRSDEERRMHFQETSSYRGIMPYVPAIYKNDFVEAYNLCALIAFSAISIC